MDNERDFRPRILCIAPLPPPVHGSAVVSRQIQDSPAIGEAFQMDFINLSSSRSMDEIDHFHLLKLFRITKAWFLTFFRLLTRHYDLCYIALTCHGKGFLKDAPFALLCKLFRKRLVIHQHNKGMAEDAGRWPYKPLLRAVYRNATVLLLAEALYQDISSIVSREQVMICPNGKGDPEPSKPISRSHSDGEGVKLLFISNLIPSKGVYDLIKACRILNEQNKQFLCSIVGNETAEITEEDLRHFISINGLEQLGSYEGPLYQDEKTEILKASDIFVLPTYNECFPLCILEAMQQELPIVTTDEGGIPEMVLDGINGLICEKNNPESLAKAIGALIDNGEMRRSMGRESRSLYLKRFTANCFEKQFIRCIQDCLTTRSQPHRQ